MGNSQHEDLMFKEEKKNLFMRNYGIGTKKIYSRIFHISQAVEHDLNKDLHDFNREELRQLLFMFMPTTAASSRGTTGYISKYVDWAILQGYRRGINPISMTDTAWKEQFVVNVKRLWTNAEINSILSKLANFQDAVLVILPFSGVLGEASSEIMNLQRKDVDIQNNVLQLRDADGNERSITVSDQCIAICERAIREYEYEKTSVAGLDMKSPVAQLIDSDLVVKVANTNALNLGSPDKSVVHRRLAKISEYLEEPNFTPFNLRNSGMLFMAYELMKENGKLEDEQYDKIFEQFGEKSENVKQRMKVDFLNESKVKEMYHLF